MYAPWNILKRDAEFQSIRRRLDWVDQIIMLANSPGKFYNYRLAGPVYTEMLRVQSLLDARRDEAARIHDQKMAASERILVARGLLDPAA
jgi:hypothetical protein